MKIKIHIIKDVVEVLFVALSNPGECRFQNFEEWDYLIRQEHLEFPLSLYVHTSHLFHILVIDLILNTPFDCFVPIKADQ